MQNWQHIHAAGVPWKATDGAEHRVLLWEPVVIEEWRVPEGGRLELDGLGLIGSGTTSLAEERAGTGALLWSRHGIALEALEGPLRLYRLEMPEALAPDSERFVINADDCSWESFDDPAGRPTQPVQVLLEGPLAALRTRFAPDFEAGEHWHDFDTLYFITDGDMQFGSEGQYHVGDIRHVRGGFSYGPEKPGPEGVEFVLFSLGGAVALRWADLEAAPNGSLP